MKKGYIDFSARKDKVLRDVNDHLPICICVPAESACQLRKEQFIILKHVSITVAPYEKVDTCPAFSLVLVIG